MPGVWGEVSPTEIRQTEKEGGIVPQKAQGTALEMLMGNPTDACHARLRARAVGVEANYSFSSPQAVPVSVLLSQSGRAAITKKHRLGG